jgi:hypothetical protein
MDGTTRKARKPKRLTEELPFWCELAFSRAYSEGLTVANGGKCEGLSFTSMTPWFEVAGYNAGRAKLDRKQAFAALQDACAKHGFHRD